MPETKGVSVLTADIKATKADDGSYDITLSLPELDRDDEVIDAKALTWSTPGRMPIDVDHGMTVLSTVGSGLPTYDGDVLKLTDFRFASTLLAQDVKTLVDEEHVSKMSVAFMAAKREKDSKDGKMHIRSAELLNAAIVAIPSLRSAEILIGKALAGKTGARNSTKDGERLQSIHDLAVENGAECATKSPSSLLGLAGAAGRLLFERADQKAVEGSYEERADQLREAVQANHPEADWVWVRATFDDSVIYEVQNDDGTSTTWQATYETTDDGFVIDDPTEVGITEIVKPSTDTDPDEEAAALAAADRPADVNVGKARRELLAAEAALALL
jgi:hypothetical protein